MEEDSYSGCEIQYIALSLVSPFTEAANVLLLDDVCRIHDSDMLPTISPQSARLQRAKAP